MSVGKPGDCIPFKKHLECPPVSLTPLLVSFIKLCAQMPLNLVSITPSPAEVVQELRTISALYRFPIFHSDAFIFSLFQAHFKRRHTAFCPPSGRVQA